MNPPAENAFVIRTAQLRMRFDHGEAEVAALRGVDLAVRAGEFLCVMGPSGSGKTTLLSILGCLERPTDGDYQLAGENVAYVDEREAARVRRERIGFVFRGFSLVARSTALQNVGCRLRTPVCRRPNVAIVRSPPCLRSAWWAGPTTCPTSSPMVSSNVSRWRARSSSGPTSCWPTNRPATSTRALRNGFSTSWGRCMREVSPS